MGADVQPVKSPPQPVWADASVDHATNPRSKEEMSRTRMAAAMLREVTRAREWGADAAPSGSGSDQSVWTRKSCWPSRRKSPLRTARGLLSLTYDPLELPTSVTVSRPLLTASWQCRPDT